MATINSIICICFRSFPNCFASFNIYNLLPVFHPGVATAIIYPISNSPYLLMLSGSPAVYIINFWVVVARKQLWVKDAWQWPCLASRLLLVTVIWRCSGAMTHEIIWSKKTDCKLAASSPVCVCSLSLATPNACWVRDWQTHGLAQNKPRSSGLTAPSMNLLTASSTLDSLLWKLQNGLPIINPPQPFLLHYGVCWSQLHPVFLVGFSPSAVTIQPLPQQH